MATKTSPPKTGTSSGGTGLKKKVGPLPVWGWIVAGLVFYEVYKGGLLSGTSSGTTTSVAPSGANSQPWSYGYSGGGSGGGGGAVPGGGFPGQTGPVSPSGTVIDPTTGLPAPVGPVSSVPPEIPSSAPTIYGYPPTGMPTTTVTTEPTPGIQSITTPMSGGQPAPSEWSAPAFAATNYSTHSNAHFTTNNPPPPLTSKGAAGTPVGDALAAAFAPQSTFTAQSHFNPAIARSGGYYYKTSSGHLQQYQPGKSQLSRGTVLYTKG